MNPDKHAFTMDRAAMVMAGLKERDKMPMSYEELNRRYQQQKIDNAVLLEAIEDIVRAWEGGNLAGMVNAARETANELRNATAGK